MNIADDLVRAFNDGYTQGKADAVVRGEWIEVCDDCDAWLECNLCGEYYGEEGEPNFCHKCGADMRRESEVKV